MQQEDSQQMLVLWFSFSASSITRKYNLSVNKLPDLKYFNSANWVNIKTEVDVHLQPPSEP